MTDLFKRFEEDLQLKGMSKTTIKMYTRAVRQLTKHYQKSPEEITDEELRLYFLYNMNERQWSRVTSTIWVKSNKGTRSANIFSINHCYSLFKQRFVPPIFNLCLCHQFWELDSKAILQQILTVKIGIKKLRPLGIILKKIAQKPDLASFCISLSQIWRCSIMSAKRQSQELRKWRFTYLCWF